MRRRIKDVLSWLLILVLLLFLILGYAKTGNREDRFTASTEFVIDEDAVDQGEYNPFTGEMENNPFFNSGGLG